MTDMRLQIELTETKAELQILKDRITAGTQAILEDFSLIALIPKLGGLETGISLEEFLSTIENTEKLEKFAESFFASFNTSLNAHSPRAPSREGQTPHSTAVQSRAGNRMRGQRKKAACTDVNLRSVRNRNAHTETEITCYECTGRFGHDGPTRLNRESKSSNSPGKRNPSERSRRSRSSGERPEIKGSESTRRTTFQGNGKEV